MTDPDPIDDLLRAAVARDFAATVAPDLERQVVARIRQRLQWRRWLLGGAATSGLAAASWQWQSAVAWIGAVGPALEPVSPASLLLLAALAAGSMLVLAEESL